MPIFHRQNRISGFPVKNFPGKPFHQLILWGYFNPQLSLANDAQQDLASAANGWQDGFEEARRGEVWDIKVHVWRKEQTGGFYLEPQCILHGEAGNVWVVYEVNYRLYDIME